jgi:hypothetical protein
MSIILLFLVLLNFVISWFNAWSVGRGWAETKVAGGFARFMSWCGAIMSASGFTWCYLVIICIVGQLIPGRYHLPDKYAEGVFRLGYLIIILPYTRFWFGYYYPVMDVLLEGKKLEKWRSRGLEYTCGYLQYISGCQRYPRISQFSG